MSSLDLISEVWTHKCGVAMGYRIHGVVCVLFKFKIVSQQSFSHITMVATGSSILTFIVLPVPYTDTGATSHSFTPKI